MRAALGGRLGAQALFCAQRRQRLSQLFYLADQFFVAGARLLHHFCRRSLDKENIIEPRREPASFVLFPSHFLRHSLALFLKIDQPAKRNCEVYSACYVASCRVQCRQCVGYLDLLYARETLYLFGTRAT